ncbi:lysophospholipase [Candidatus Pseudoscillospira sp. SGI.172]|uniref:alpha/beta hydrolase n=1 Tax=Candidatus Pseudoscillospira sp. SGI.172 TaxID=3420582 RepID=UPI003CFF7CA9
MGKQQDFTFPSADGVHTVHAVLWPADGETGAVVQIVHGISEYAERYASFAAFLNARGYAVVGHDHLGHGRTAGEGEYGYFPERDGWHTVNRDVRRMRELTGERYPGMPYFLLGHSMGSFQARTYLIDYPGTVDGCILSGTGQEPAVLVAFGRLLSGVLCRIQGPGHVSRLITALSLGAYNGRFKPNRTSADWISRDTEVVDAYVADKLCRFVPTVGMFHAMMEGIAYIGAPKNAAKMDRSTPVALFSGDADPVGGEGKGVQKVFQLFQAAGCEDVRCKLYPGARHEILNETNRLEVWQDMLDWLEEHRH